MRASRAWRVALAIAAATGLVAACGSESDASRETIDITMVDNAFQPDRITLPRGEKVTLRFTNEGSVRHEALVGGDAAQASHHAEMAEAAMGGEGDDGHGGGHGSPANSVTVEPGEQESLAVTVDEDGEVFVGCHEPGHWEDGMMARVALR